MSKHKAKRPSKKAVGPRTEPTETKGWAQRWWAVLLGICSVVGGPAAIVGFLPRIVVSPPSVATPAENVFDISFDIVNSGVISLKHVSACLAVGEIVSAPHRLDQGLIFDPDKMSELCRNTWGPHDLEADERFTIKLTDIASMASEADIAISVRYRPWFLPITQKKIFRFIARKDINGSATWRSWPLSEPGPVN